MQKENLPIFACSGASTLKFLTQNKKCKTSNRVDAPVMRQLKIDRFEINALKLQAVSHNTTRLIIPASTLGLTDGNF